MGAAKTANTQAEILQSIAQDIQKAKLAPDADMPFLTSLETTILSYLKAPIQQMTGQLPPYGGPTAGNGGGGPLGGPAAGRPPMPAQGPQLPGPLMPSPVAARQQMSGPQAPNMDEIRRMMGRSAG